MALRLHEATHDPEHGVQLLDTLGVPRGDGGRDNGVEGTLARRQAVWVLLVQDEVGATILR